MILIGDWAPGNKRVKISKALSLVLANLEGPILPCSHLFFTAHKAGQNLFSSELPDRTGQFIFSLANNHIMDYGVSGLEISLTALDQRGFKACGIGRNIVEARQPIIVEDNGIRVGIIACCEAQFGVSRRNHAGVAEFGPWVYQAIHDLCRTVNAVIVSVHAGVENSPWPSLYIRELYYSFIDAGATIVHGHHAHVPQGYEAHGNGVIFYGMGNFAVDPDKWRNYPNGLWSLAAEIDFGSKPVRWQPMTFEIRHQSGSDTMMIEKSSIEEHESHQRYMEICNRPFGDDALLEALWQEVAMRAYCYYGAGYMGFSTSLRSRCCALIKKGLSKIRNILLNRPFVLQSGQYDLMLRYNMIVCESHRQMLETALGILAGEIKDVRSEETRKLADEMLSKRDV